MIADKLNVAELMTPDVTALPPVVPVQQLLDVLRSSNHQVGAQQSAVTSRYLDSALLASQSVHLRLHLYDSCCCKHCACAHHAAGNTAELPAQVFGLCIGGTCRPSR